MDKDGIIGSIDDLAGHFGKSRRTVYRWIDAGMPVLPDGRFDVLAVTAWRKRRRGLPISSSVSVAQGQAGENVAGQGGAGAGAEIIGDKDFWDRESKKEQALRRQLDRRKLQGELIEWSRIEAVFISRVLEVKSLLLGFERLLPPELIQCRTDREMSERIRKFTRRALSQFSRPLPENLRPKNAPADDQ